MTPKIALSPLFVSSVGFDRFNDLFEQLVGSNPSDGYPPYDIEKLEDDRYRITLAVAGFSDQDLKITAKDGQLIVSGRRASAAKAEGVSYLYRGIAEREFERSFALADYMVVTNAELRDGLLQIDLVRELPDELKPRRIEIKAGAGTQAVSQTEGPKRLS